MINSIQRFVENGIPKLEESQETDRVGMIIELKCGEDPDCFGECSEFRKGYFTAWLSALTHCSTSSVLTWTA